MRRLRTPIKIPLGRPLRGLEYARFSNDEQNPLSNADQFAFCDRALEGEGVVEAETLRFSDEGISGEIVSRPGIDGVRKAIVEGKFDLLVAEESSRLYRNENACFDLVYAAVDNGVRVICFNDGVDTDDEDWEDRLHEAQRHHCKANVFTSRRIKRAHDSLWNTGAAIGQLRPGYKRRATHPATSNSPAEGPYFDEIDEVTSLLIVQAFESIAAGLKPWQVADFLTSSGLLKRSNASLEYWTDDTVRALIRDTTYRGVEPFRKTFSTKQRLTGRQKPKRNNPEDVLVRDMPHLRIVEDWLWHAANDAIDARNRNDAVNGPGKHPLAGVRRNARGPLSGIIRCRCGANMESDGSKYRCPNGKRRRGTCWNKATAAREFVHRVVSDAIRKQLLQFRSNLLALLADLSCRLGNPAEWADRRRVLNRKLEEANGAMEQYRSLAEAGSCPPATLLQWISEGEVRIARIEAEIQRVADEEHSLTLPSHAALLGEIDRLSDGVDTMHKDVRDDLLLLIRELEVGPFAQFGSDKVVLRGRLALDFRAVFPARVALFLKSLDREILPAALCPPPMFLDLFIPSTGPKHGPAALKLSEEGEGLSAIGLRLGITKRQANIAVQYGRGMREAGWTEPFEELTEKPERASRWGSHTPQICPISQLPTL